MRILILGSMSFSREMKVYGDKLVSLGHEVTLPVFIEDYLEFNTHREMHEKAVVNKLNNNLYKTYHQLIEKNDAIFIANEKKKDIGANTLIKMAMARALEKKVYLVNKIHKMDYTDEIKAVNPIILHNALDKIGREY